MPVCPVCKRAFDERLQVFVPPRTEAFDTIECALRATRGRADDAAGFATESPVLHIELRPPLTLLEPGLPTGGPAPRRQAAAAAGLGAVLAKVVAAPSAAAAGLSLLGAGAAASIYLGWLSFGSGSQMLSSRAVSPRLPTRQEPRRVVEPRPALTVPHVKPENYRPKPAAPLVKPKPTRAVRHVPPAPSETELESEGPLPGRHAGAASSGQGKLAPPSPPAAKLSGRLAAPHPATAPPTASPPGPRPHTPKPSKPGNENGGNIPAPSMAPSQPSLQPSGPSPSEPPPPPPPPPPVQPTSSSEKPSRPGNGYGDKNHQHTGPPGQQGKQQSKHGEG